MIKRCNFSTYNIKIQFFRLCQCIQFQLNIKSTSIFIENALQKLIKEFNCFVMLSFSGLSIHPFCNKVKRDPLETECTEDRTSVALCNLVEHQEKLPLMYRNFDSIPHVTPGRESYYGGSVSLADYCPYIQEFTWRSRNVIVRGSHCQYIENNPSECKQFLIWIRLDQNYNEFMTSTVHIQVQIIRIIQLT